MECADVAAFTFARWQIKQIKIGNKRIKSRNRSDNINFCHKAGIKKSAFKRNLEQYIAVFTWRHHFLKSKTKDPPKFLSSSGIRGGMLVMEGAWHKATIEFVEKYIFMSWFCALLEVKALGKLSAYVNACFSVLIISRLNSQLQSKFQMFTQVSGRHIGVSRT